MNTSATPSPAGTIIVERTAGQDIKMRDLYLRIDDHAEETLRFGTIYSVDLPVGEHSIKATNRLFSRTQKFTLSADQIIRFSATNVASKSIFSIVAFLSGSVLYKVVLERLD